MTTPIDPRAEPPEQPKTAQLPAADLADIRHAELKNLFVMGMGALDTKMAIGLKDINAKVDRVEVNQAMQSDAIAKLKHADDVIFGWKAEIDQRLNSNSIRAKAPSSFDLEQDARLANALLELEEEKAHRKRLEENSATKADVKAVVDAAAQVQTTDIVTSLSREAEKNPTLRYILLAIAGLLFLAINTGTQILLSRGAQPPAQIQEHK